MSRKVIPFPGLRAGAPVPRDIRPYPPKAIVTWPEGLAGAISIYPLGNSDDETMAIVKALEEALKPRRQ